MPVSTSSIADRFSAPLDRVRTRYARSPLQQFMQWWGGELAALLPASWRALFAEGHARVFYAIVGNTLELRLEESRSASPLASIPLDPTADMPARVDALLGTSRVDRPRWLLLPSGLLLRRQLTLPVAATERLRDVVAHELDRQTPFRPDQVVFDCRVLAIDATNKTAQVELLVLPKDKLEAALAPLGALADRLSGVDARDAGSHGQPGQPLQCNLLAPERRQRRDRRALWLHLGLAAIALIALLFGMNRILDNRRAAVTRLETAVAARHEQARLVGVLSRQLELAADGANFLTSTRAGKPPMLAVLAEISALIPDNTYIERFSEQDGQIYLTGQSADAAGLVAKLQASKLLQSPALSGSVQPDAASHRDHFTLVAGLVSASGKASPSNAPSSNGGAAHAPAQP